MTFDTPVSTLPFVGPKYQQLLSHLGISTVGDLLYHLPNRYVDLSHITPIETAAPDELTVIQASVESVKKVRLKSGKTMVSATVHDDTGQLHLTWFNQPFIEKSLIMGKPYRFAGEIEFKFGHVQMSNPAFELASKPMVHTGRIVPIYPQTAGISSKWLRARLAPLLSKLDILVPEFLPASTLARQQLIPLPQAIRQLHAPSTMDEAIQARHRLAFDELLLLQLSALQRKANLEKGPAAPFIAVEPAALTQWATRLPFQLTAAQHRVVDEILADMAKTKPMNRLMEGDVGSGKTVVAYIAALAAVHNGFQVAVMAPTSVLANQHFITFQRLIDSLPLPRPSITLRTAKSKFEPADITVGTHALIADGVEFGKLGLVIIDEQHRFGVEQRAQLLHKASSGVHLLSMTATPIPRTLALTAYGDLDLSIIDQMPAHRLPIKTHVVPQAKRQDMEEFLRQTMQRGEQVYIICPLIEASDTLVQVRAATTEFERLQKIFSGLRLALLHGRLKAGEKDDLLADFKNRRFDALVATPVVEVGIDVPNATVMVIEGAERFGLAQLHQLRGRVGRGQVQSYCFLLSDATKVEDVERLRHLEKERSGIALAEIDLVTRGPGEVYGHRQSGIPDLKAADITDVELVKRARTEAEHLSHQLGLQLTAEIQNQILRTQHLIAMN